MDGWMDGMDGISKVSFKNLHTLLVYRKGIYLLIHVIKNCRQHSYGFKNLMSSWGLGTKFSKSQLVGEFSIFGSKWINLFLGPKVHFLGEWGA